MPLFHRQGQEVASGGHNRDVSFAHASPGNECFPSSSTILVLFCRVHIRIQNYPRSSSLRFTSPILGYAQLLNFKTSYSITALPLSSLAEAHLPSIYTAPVGIQPNRGSIGILLSAIMTVKGLKNALVALLAASIATGVKADCECGYSTHVGNSKKATVFTELLETDFSRTNDLTKNGEWMLPTFNVTKEQTHGAFGLTFRPGNVMALANKGQSSARSVPEKDDKSNKADKHKNSDKTPTVKDAALQLHVSGKLDEDMVSVAEIDSRGADLQYGSYRTSMQLTDVPGTCAAFMWVSIPSFEATPGKGCGAVRDGFRG